MERAHAILNAKAPLGRLVENLRPIFTSTDKDTATILITKEPLDSAVAILGSFGIPESTIYRITKITDYDSGPLEEGRRFVLVSMPNNLFHSLPKAYNWILELNSRKNIARYVHFFADDIRFCAGAGESYDPRSYERFSRRFNEPFVIDCKTNPANFAFRKMSPRFVFISSKLEAPISYYQYEAKEHFMVDTELVSDRFDENLQRMYITEMLIRLHERGVVRHLTFYPDPVIEPLVEQTDEFGHLVPMDVLAKEYESDRRHFALTLKKEVVAETSVDPIVAEVSAVLGAEMKDANMSEQRHEAAAANGEGR